MEKSKKKYTLIIEKGEDGYGGRFEDYPVFTTGETLMELLANALEAINFHLEDEGLYTELSRIDPIYDLPSLFRYYPINQKGLAQRLKINDKLLSQYVTGAKKPSKKRQRAIVKGVREVGKELSELSLLP
jgi:predicted RNase H-like HicB family nuclease